MEVIRLDTFMAERGIDTIDLLEVDAQGEDLRVVQSLGDRIGDVRRIQIEVNIHSAPLYANSFRLADALSSSPRTGSSSTCVWTQSLNREANVIFRNRRFYPSAARQPDHVGRRAARPRCVLSPWLKLPRVLAVTGMMLKTQGPSEGTR